MPGMPRRITPAIRLDAVQRTQLEELVKAPPTVQGIVLRAHIVLAAADQKSDREIAAGLGTPRLRWVTGAGVLPNVA